MIMKCVVTGHYKKKMNEEFRVNVSNEVSVIPWRKTIGKKISRKA